MVGAIYQQIIEDVLNTSRVDFEEGGVEEGILDELRKVRTDCHRSHPFLACVFHPNLSCAANECSHQDISKSCPTMMQMRFAVSRWFCRWQFLAWFAVCLVVLPAGLAERRDGGEGGRIGWATRCYLAF